MNEHCQPTQQNPPLWVYLVVLYLMLTPIAAVLWLAFDGWLLLAIAAPVMILPLIGILIAAVFQAVPVIPFLINAAMWVWASRQTVKNKIDPETGRWKK